MQLVMETVGNHIKNVTFLLIFRFQHRFRFLELFFEENYSDS